MKYLLFAIFFLLLGACVNAQSMFKPLPHYKPVSPGFHANIVTPFDSLPSISTGTWQGFRFAGPDIMFSIPDFSAWTGLGLDYVWATANTTTRTWSYKYTIGIRAMGGANLGAPTVKAIGGVGIRFTLFNGYLALGGIYNLTTKAPQAAIGNPAALIPGLN